MSPRRPQSAVVLMVVALGLAAACDDDPAPTPEVEPPPNIRITEPRGPDALVYQPSFEVGGDFAGSATEIELSIDGELVGDATRGEVAFDWRVLPGRFSVTPGRHLLTAIARGEGGPSRPAEMWIWYEPDPSVGFRIAIDPPTATYEVGEDEDDPQLRLFGPPERVDLDLSVQGQPPVIEASVTEQLGTGADTRVRVDIVGEQPGTYPIVVTAVSGTGETMQATHTITITGPPPPTTASPTTAPPTDPPTTASADRVLAVLADDFEGPDRWTATTRESTNGAAGTVELAAGGNPGQHRRMRHDMPGTADGENNPTQLSVIHLFADGWDPSTDGPIGRIDVREDQIEYDPPFDGAAIGTRIAIVQGETTYLASINADNVFRNTHWQTVQVLGLTPADFTPAPGPDFSEAGGPLSFGYLRSNTSRSSTGIVTQHGVDNWSVTLHGP